MVKLPFAFPLFAVVFSFCTLILFGVSETAFAREPVELETELGYETIARIPEDPMPANPTGEFSMNRPYIIQKIDIPMALEDNTHALPLDAFRPDKFEAEYRAWANFSYLQSNSGQKSSVDLRGLKLFWAGESWNLVLGLQDIVWGETFGDRGVDVINPRDYSDYLLTDLKWSILPVWSINLLKLFGPFSMQVVYTPLTVNDQYPVEVGGVPISNDTVAPLAFTDSEYGARLGLLLPEGTDLKFYYYYHYNRIPVVQANFTSSETISGFQNRSAPDDRHLRWKRHARSGFICSARRCRLPVQFAFDHL